MEVGGQRHAPATLPLERSPGTHYTGVERGPGPVRAGVDDIKSLDHMWVRSPNRPFYGGLQHRLRHTPSPPPEIVFLILSCDLMKETTHFRDSVVPTKLDRWKMCKTSVKNFTSVSSLCRQCRHCFVSVHFLRSAACTENIIRTSDPIPALLLHNPLEVHPSTPFTAWLTHDAI